MNNKDCLVIVRGGGDLASGTIYTLHQCGYKVIVLETQLPTTIRRKAAFSEAVYQGEFEVEGVKAVCVKDIEDIDKIVSAGYIPVIIDPDGEVIEQLKPDVVVDAIIAKKNLGTKKSMAPLVIGLGPGFVAGVDVHVVIETMRGHHLGKIIRSGQAAPNTGVPGNIGGFTKERVIHAPSEGVMKCVATIGDIVKKGDIIAYINDAPVYATLDGVLRGLLREGLVVPVGFKIADIDPRISEKENCITISDKARTIAGGVLQAVLMYGKQSVKIPKDVPLTALCTTGGCGAKIGAGTLADIVSRIPVKKDQHLLVGFDCADDAGVYQLSEDIAIIQTLDFFPPIVDDPYLYGKIAATNALSDVYAMGGTVKTAMNIVGFPEFLDIEILGEILRGGAEKVLEAGAVLCGGHSIKDNEPKYGLSVTGVIHPDSILTNKGAKPGDVLILTKKLGVGIVTAAHKVELDSLHSFDEAVDSMTLLNRYACEAMAGLCIHACTDVTGFGFLGHLYEMTSASDVSAIIYHENLPVIEAAKSYANDFIITCAAQRNRLHVGEHVEFVGIDFCMEEIMFDPQTSGGLLIACDSKDADELLKRLKVMNPNAAMVGQIIEKNEKYMTII